MQEDALIEAALESVLGPLKEDRRVKAWSWTLGHDHEGQDAIFVFIVMNDPERGELKWSRVKPIHDRVAAELRDKDPFRWPYVRFRLASEVSAGDQDAH